MADAESAEGMKRFTADELKEFDGKEGRRAYIAYHGRVYDVTDSRLWRNGVHVRAHHAGEDLSTSMPAAPHDDDVMEGFEVVGSLYDPSEFEGAEEQLPLAIAFSLDHHLHPIAVHFPTALGAVSPVFLLASFAIAGAAEIASGLQQASFWCLVVCLLGSVPSIFTGWISWKYNYASVMTPIYRVKWGGSVVLVVLCVIAILIKYFMLGGFAQVDPQNSVTWLYTALCILVAATVAVLGHYGGKITFPS